MTKPCNFPERINQRRKRALERARTQWLGMDVATVKARHFKMQIDTLDERIAPSLRHVRTKKNRSGGTSRAGRKAMGG